MPRDVTWREQAACRAEDTELFFPPSGTQDAVEAKAYCARCTVCAECLEYALTEGMAEGVWGGFSASERQRIATRRRMHDGAPLGSCVECSAPFELTRSDRRFCSHACQERHANRRRTA